jgi:phosphoglycerate dehydrogenase-like enzyme
MTAFKVGVSHDLYSATGPTSWGDIGLGGLTEAGIDWEFLPEDDGFLRADAVDGHDAILFAAPAVTAATVSGARPPRLFARFGVGLDTVDLPACTSAGSAVTITPDGARRAVATAALTLILAVNHRLLNKHQLVVTGRWQDKQALMGRGLTGRTVGTIGLGNIALELFDLLAPFRTVNLSYDPHRPADQAPRGVELVELDELLTRCDVLVVTAALTPDTHHLLDTARLALLPAHAIVVNVARGPIINTAALTEALQSGRLAGAGLDVFDPEPLPADHPLTSLDSVVLSPHALAWTDEMAAGNGASAIRAIIAVRDGVPPDHLANPEVLQHPRFAGFTDLVQERS